MTQTEQLSLNADFLRSQIDVAHAALCPNKIATWQNQARQVAIAARVVRDLLDEAPCTCPNPDGSYPHNAANEDCFLTKVNRKFFWPAKKILARG